LISFQKEKRIIERNKRKEKAGREGRRKEEGRKEGKEQPTL
jgi:hypothetical protein